uniref:Uncharacterized protein n=1 Tax=Wuchereria bancrofti TaxID=6293 RepID=A0AAF5PT10_WUCBA
MRNGKSRKPAISSVNDIHPELLKILYNLPPDFEVQVKMQRKKVVSKENIETFQTRNFKNVPSSHITG